MDGRGSGHCARAKLLDRALRAVRSVGPDDDDALSRAGQDQPVEIDARFDLKLDRPAVLFRIGYNARGRAQPALRLRRPLRRRRKTCDRKRKW